MIDDNRYFDTRQLETFGPNPKAEISTKVNAIDNIRVHDSKGLEHY